LNYRFIAIKLGSNLAGNPTVRIVEAELSPNHGWSVMSNTELEPLQGAFRSAYVEGDYAAISSEHPYCVAPLVGKSKICQGVRRQRFDCGVNVANFQSRKVIFEYSPIRARPK